MQAPTPNGKADSLSMRIYSAFLGDRPRISKPDPSQRPRIRMSVRLEAKIEHPHLSPFYRPTMMEQIERCVGYAAQAIEDARTRLTSAKPQASPPPVSVEPSSQKPKPIVLIGPAATRRKQPRESTRAA